MTDPWMGVAAIGLGLALAALSWQLARARAARSAARARYLDDCLALFDEHRMQIAATGFPRIAGRYRGRAFDVQVVPDTLTVRKLPALWVLVSLIEEMPLKARFDLMVRPGGTETFSAFHTLSHQIPIPAGYPEECTIRSDDPGDPAGETVMRRHLDLFEDASVKEVIFSPKGLRIVFLAEEADRGRYLIYRDAEMGMVPLGAVRLERVLRRLTAIADDIHELEGAEMRRRDAA
ncbi:hypothetical protein DYI37_11745 [Fulvimarina endophytica]|uniref:DUF3137 domain-containing protein n=1 Tax=Fulvimarina endophytica TaxID=2293836 RepID=A0A371X354_9HYPH|nr:hypothetical protein [Fulvimarina endophytica]RFC63667.1 hypothetical protein DYI37_11745 [Fulvimarina endophytica]